jgi:hypothetical protein
MLEKIKDHLNVIQNEVEDLKEDLRELFGSIRNADPRIAIALRDIDAAAASLLVILDREAA